jgi:alkylation response protein AidB-like acyl-CoA dehydrogenase
VTKQASDVSDRDLREMVAALVAELGSEGHDAHAFRRAQFNRGLAWAHFPIGKGGLGLGRDRQAVINDALRRHGVRSNDLVVNPIGIGMAAPVLLAHADDGTQDQHLGPIFTGEEIWCQLFSEPGHGSDLAGIACRAVPSGDDGWVVNGQKVWTSLGERASWGLLLARTDPDVPKHRGLSYFIVDMRSPGVEVRPIHQITGEAEFNETFLTDVALPHSALLGSPGNGWRIAISTLMSERAAFEGARGSGGGGPIGHLRALWDEERGHARAAPGAGSRDRVTELWIRSEAIRLTGLRARANSQGGTPGPEASVGKLASTELNQAIFEEELRILGPRGMLHEPGYPMRRPDGSRSRTASWHFLRSRANTIEGGTSETMRNIIGERVLGLPAMPTPDRDMPWSQIPRTIRRDG